MKETIQRSSPKQTRHGAARERVARGFTAVSIDLPANGGAKSETWRRYASDRLRHFASGR